jgi:hypothetical protein
MAKIARELGSRQAKILVWIAKNPNHYAYEIHKGLGDIAQGNVDTDCKKLREYGLLESEKETASARYQREVDKFRCTDKGISYALVYADDDDILSILKINQDKYEIAKFFLSEYNRMGRDNFLYWFKDYITFIPSLDKDGFLITVSKMLFFYIQKYQYSNMGEAKAGLQRAADSFPSAKKSLKLIRDVVGALDLEDEKNGEN